MVAAPAFIVIEPDLLFEILEIAPDAAAELPTKKGTGS
jgi:hypothetical protein